MLGTIQVFTIQDEAMLALAKKIVKNLKTKTDLNNYSKALKKLNVETLIQTY